MISTSAVEIVVTTVIINFFMTWRGSDGLLIAMGVFMLARALLVGPDHMHGHGMS